MAQGSRDNPRLKRGFVSGGPGARGMDGSLAALQVAAGRWANTAWAAASFTSLPGSVLENLPGAGGFLGRPVRWRSGWPCTWGCARSGRHHPRQRRGRLRTPSSRVSAWVARRSSSSWPGTLAIRRRSSFANCWLVDGPHAPRRAPPHGRRRNGAA